MIMGLSDAKLCLWIGYLNDKAEDLDKELLDGV